MDIAWNSPFIVPVAGCVMILGVVVAGLYSDIQNKKLRADQRMAMLAKGIAPEEVEKILSSTVDTFKPVQDPLRSLAAARRTAVVLLSTGIGIVIFGLLLAVILEIRAVLIVPASGIIPIAIGIGFLVDYKMQAGELTRFGLEVDAEMSSKS